MSRQTITLCYPVDDLLNCFNKMCAHDAKILMKSYFFKRVFVEFDNVGLEGVLQLLGAFIKFVDRLAAKRLYVTKPMYNHINSILPGIINHTLEITKKRGETRLRKFSPYISRLLSYTKSWTRGLQDNRTNEFINILKLLPSNITEISDLDIYLKDDMRGDVEFIM